MLWEYLMSESENNPVWVGSRVNREQDNLTTKDGKKNKQGCETAC